MPAPAHIYFAEAAAYERMRAEVSASPGIETGGILVGRLFYASGGPILAVVAASGPGQHAERSPDCFAPDTNALQHALRHWRRRFVAHRVDYVGQWHTHPAGDSELSEGDRRQIAAILADPDYQLPHGLLTPIVFADGMNIALTAHYTPRDTLRPQPVPWSVLDGDMDQLLGLLAASEGADR